MGEPVVCAGWLFQNSAPETGFPTVQSMLLKEPGLCLPPQTAFGTDPFRSSYGLRQGAAPSGIGSREHDEVLLMRCASIFLFSNSIAQIWGTVKGIKRVFPVSYEISCGFFRLIADIYSVLSPHEPFQRGNQI